MELEGCRFFQQEVDDARIIEMFEAQHPGSKGPGCVAGGYRTARLQKNRAFVVMGIHAVDGDARFGIAGSDYGAVHMLSPHAFAAVAGE